LVDLKKLIIIGITLFLAACSTETITDESTRPEIELVDASKNTILVEWGSDAMDRGNHDYFTSVHGKLVVDLEYSDVSRGEVIYFKTPAVVLKRYPQSPEDYIARVVGLPGETVEIKDGRVFIDGKVLETFYAKATILGMDEEVYFSKKDTSKIVSLESTKEYFATNMDPVKVIEDTVFVLVDQWWRGTDSREFGVLPLDSVEGQVLGYLKK
jgi:signal peptidase I